jgi:predicted nuclease of predicted toxin-antitoxin system
VRYFLDEDLSHEIADIARNLGVDTISCHEIGRNGRTDEEQLRFAAHAGRAIVTINGAHFVALTSRFYEEGQPHAGVLIVPKTVPRRYFAAAAHALVDHARAHPDGMQPYSIDYLHF